MNLVSSRSALVIVRPSITAGTQAYRLSGLANPVACWRIRCVCGADGLSGLLRLAKLGKSRVPAARTNDSL